ncbi:hypothetical protein DSO57_1010189 [Entomophthora muscae]|uniref:Uncharacterized protein n=1 Tax=Entomophthora muscae TaxID=34485 RepID=A0ACC2US01_9FUNG|nr:hypothetical protein DSO57_1010189 [Entomophthora muscae]
MVTFPIGLVIEGLNLGALAHQIRNLFSLKWIPDTPQLLAIGPAPSPEAAPPLAFPSTLLYDVLVAQHSLPKGQVICAKLSSDSASNGPYSLKDRIIYQNNKVWVPKELQLVS